MNRREVLTLLSAGVLGCKRRPAEALFGSYGGPVNLGWRWVPGKSLSYTVVTVRSSGVVQVRRAETWSYLVRDLDAGNVATLEGRLTGLGAEVVVGGNPLPAEAVDSARSKEAGSASEAWLRVSMDGRVVDCRPRTFDERWPHLIFDLALPETAIREYDEWPDSGLVRAISAILPPRLEIEIEGRTRLVELSGDTGTAVLETTGSITSASGLRVVLNGTAWWDTSQGTLARRTLEARTQPSDGDPVTSPGVLSAEWEQQ